MVGSLRPQTDTRSVVEPEAPPLRLFLRNLQPPAPPAPFDPLQVHGPAGVRRQGHDAPIAVAAMLRCERDD